MTTTLNDLLFKNYPEAKALVEDFNAHYRAGFVDKKQPVNCSEILLVALFAVWLTANYEVKPK